MVRVRVALFFRAGGCTIPKVYLVALCNIALRRVLVLFSAVPSSARSNKQTFAQHIYKVSDILCCAFPTRVVRAAGIGSGLFEVHGCKKTTRVAVQYFFCLPIKLRRGSQL